MRYFKLSGTGLLKQKKMSLILLKKSLENLDGSGGLYTTPEGYVFGSVAQRCIDLKSEYKGFWTTGRGKRELNFLVRVLSVDHKNRIVHTYKDKATLNAPLLDHIFTTMPNVSRIIHAHILSKYKVPDLPILDYAPPGTVRDSIRKVKRSFVIKDHGCFLLYDKEGILI